MFSDPQEVYYAKILNEFSNKGSRKIPNMHSTFNETSANACLILFIHQCQYSFKYFQIHHWSPIFKILERGLSINMHIQRIFCKDISKIVYSSMSIFAVECFQSTIKPSDKKSIMLLFIKYHSFWFFPLKLSIKINSSWNFNSLEQVQ